MMFQPRRAGYQPGGFGGFGFGSHLTTWVKRLLLANTAVYLAMALGILPAGPVIRWLGFSNTDALLRPWSWVTYMFLHGGFGHLFVNMLTLFFFGPPLERTWGGRYFIQYYLVAGLGGALFSLLLYPLIGPSLVVGASGAIFGLLLAFALNWPDAQIYLYFLVPVKAKWFVAFLGFFNLYALIAGGGGQVAYWAHLGGLATGWVYLRYSDQITRATRRLIWKEKSRSVKVQESRREPRASKRRRRSVNGDSLDEVDRILDKIRESGIDSLTPKERAFLDEMSRRYKKTSEHLH